MSGDGQRVICQIVDASGLAPYAGALRALERQIVYPIADGADHFVIDHGERYAAFYEELGEARWMVVKRGDQVVGSLAGAWREAYEGSERVDALYLGDLKLAREARGAGLVPRMVLHGIRELFARRELRGWQLVYMAAMRGEGGGDVMRTARGKAHPARWLRPLARQALYFVPARTFLAQRWGDGPGVSAEGLNLSPVPRGQRAELLETTWGRKDFKLRSTGRGWPLVHVTAGPDVWGERGLGEHLRRCVAEFERRGYDEASCEVCFGLDERLEGVRAWLEREHGLVSGATCTVYGLRVEALSAPRPVSWVHLSSSQI